MSTELLELAKNLIQLQRVLAHDATLQEKRVSRTGAVANFAQAVHALIGINPDDGAGAGSRLHNSSYAHIGDLQRGRGGIGIYAFGIRFHRIAQKQAAS
jgi:hypothetical protein